jgi:hypothetical protein
MAQRVTGAFILRINGDAYPITDGVFTPTGWTVEQVRAGTINAGNRMTKRFPRFSGKIPHQAGLSILGIAQLDQAEVTIETDTGSVWQMMGATANESGEVSESDGMITLELLGDDSLEVVA